LELISGEVKEEIKDICSAQIKKGSQAIIAGNTELPLVLKNGDFEISVINPAYILVKCAEKAKENN